MTDVRHPVSPAPRIASYTQPDGARRWVIGAGGLAVEAVVYSTLQRGGGHLWQIMSGYPGSHLPPECTAEDLRAAWMKWVLDEYPALKAFYDLPPEEQLKTDGIPRPARKKQTPQEHIQDIVQTHADPFALSLRYPPDYRVDDKRGKLTPLGLVVEIAAWWHRHYDEITAALSQHDGAAHQFANLMQDVEACVTRERTAYASTPTDAVIPRRDRTARHRERCAQDPDARTVRGKPRRQRKPRTKKKPK